LTIPDDSKRCDSRLHPTNQLLEEIRMNESKTQAKTRAKLTPKQSTVLGMRLVYGATLEEMAAWLKISERAVLYRLANARRRVLELMEADPTAQLPATDDGPIKWRRRFYNASQLSLKSDGKVLQLDKL
jgi:DNA-binding NarL/FixJ family response regulator